MASRALTICRQPGCGRRCRGRYCSSHSAGNPEQNVARERERNRRAAGIRRLYDSVAWRNRTRPYILARDPLCQIGVLCGGSAPSTDIDHVIPAEQYIEMHGGDYSFFYDESNLRGACHADHTRKTSLERHGLWKERDRGLVMIPVCFPPGAMSGGRGVESLKAELARPAASHARVAAAKDFLSDNG